MLVEEEKRMLSKRAQSGFTLVELCIVMAIMAILMALGIRPYRDWVENNKIRNAAESISSGLMLARSEAVTRNTSVNLTLAAGTSSAWTVGCTVPVAGTCPAAIHNRQESEGSSGAITVLSPAGRTITFNNLGRMTLPLVPGSIDINIDNTSLPAATSNDLRVNVSVGGGIRVCNPNVVAPDARAC
ncbi:MAG: GspH/FimT family pseudopilin [Rhodocyclaceae bacterium]|nr:GspH/FimT family pseudopilin [Rhodocyclaceae bacterium]